MIAIPVLTLVPGVVGGTETYVRELLAALVRTGRDDLRVVAPTIAADAASGLPSRIAERYKGPRLVAMARGSTMGELLEGASAVHYPLTIPIPRPAVPHALTLHDVQHLDLARLFSRPERVWRALAYDRAARRADRVIVVSEFVKERAVDRLGLDPGRVHVTPLGVDRTTLVPGPPERDPVVLYPAKGWPHKNHARLFDAWKIVRARRPELRLVLTGGFGKPVPEGVEDRGHVRRAEVVSLLRRASALVFPSLYEGFGLPPLEAMACATPVACSDRAALPEVVGDAARLFDPDDPEAIAEGILGVLDDPASWVERGLARAAAFSWDDTARLTGEVYDALLAEE